jgi:hypothetical protein
VAAAVELEPARADPTGATRVSGGGRRRGGARERELDRDRDREPKPGELGHPDLSPADDAAQRGADPPDSIGGPTPPEPPKPDPSWVPDAAVIDTLKGRLHELGGDRPRPHREDVLPYLLIRAYAPGDRAVRPTWPPIPCWLSPDIQLIEASWTGPFRADLAVGEPEAGRTYRVFVHVWNLGLLTAAGVHVRAWHTAPGFFGGQPGVTPQLIGGTFVDLPPRTAAGAHQVVEVQPPWAIPTTLTGHECLLASAGCPTDPWAGSLDANGDRHVGQRNLTILAGSSSAAGLLGQLGEALGQRQLLELTLASPRPEAERFGLPIAGGRHLLVAARRDDRLFVLPSARLAEWSEGKVPDLSRPGTAARLFDRVLRRAANDVPTGTLADAVGKLFDVPDLRAARLATLVALPDTPATLHLAAFGSKDEPIGGYSVGLIAKRRRVG